MSYLLFSFPDTTFHPLTEVQFTSEYAWISYSLFIRVGTPQIISVGRFGTCEFPDGNYIYTGSARRNMLARLNRHLRQSKKLRWHIDYLLAAPSVVIHKVLVSTLPECELVAAGGGQVVLAGFGASDCRCGCGSHLRKL
ncbi:MAG: GIY-YIG nuclease family protein [Deltaproteobacteria bacterium]|nr:GIY-YIG nuclease family protein [Deltaproteobacteria bacterium]